MSKAKKKKKRKKKLPKNYNPNVDPDPERWVPRRERTGYRKTRKERRKGEKFTGAQGNAAGQAETYDYSKKVAAMFAYRVAPFALLALLRQASTVRVSETDENAFTEPSFCKNIKGKCSAFQSEKCKETCAALDKAFCTTLEEAGKKCMSKQDKERCPEVCRSLSAPKGVKSVGESLLCKKIGGVHGKCSVAQMEKCPEKCTAAFCSALQTEKVAKGKLCDEAQLKKCPDNCADVKKSHCDKLDASLAVTKGVCHPDDAAKCPAICAKATCGSLSVDLPLKNKVCSPSQSNLCPEVCKDVAGSTCAKIQSTLILAKQQCGADELSQCAEVCAEVKSAHCKGVGTFLRDAGEACDAAQLETCPAECAAVAKELEDELPEGSPACKKITKKCTRFHEDLCPKKCRKLMCTDLQLKLIAANKMCGSKDRHKCARACKRVEKAPCEKLGTDLSASGETCSAKQQLKCAEVCERAAQLHCSKLGSTLAAAKRLCKSAQEKMCPDTCGNLKRNQAKGGGTSLICKRIKGKCNHIQKQKCVQKCSLMECEELKTQKMTWEKTCTAAEATKCPIVCADVQQEMGSDVDETEQLPFCKRLTKAPCSAFHMKECPKKCAKLKCDALGRVLSSGRKKCSGPQTKNCPKVCKRAANRGRR